jgi:DNA-binding CsgD family transcriptional regulator
VKEIDKKILGKIKKLLVACLKGLEKEGIILINTGDRHWVNSFATEIITRRGISLRDFMEWIKLGSSQLQDISYGDIHVHICKLRHKEVVALIQLECKETGDIKEICLTRKQKQILRYVSKGLSNKQIANKLNISPGTVNTHLDNIYLKLGCSSRFEASLIAIKNGLFLCPEEIPSKNIVK